MVKLLLGDCLDKLKEIESGSVKCIVTSPPYWKGFEYEAYFNSYAQYLDWSYDWMKECKRVLSQDGTFFLNIANDSETTVRVYELMEIATRKLMYKLHDTIIWYRYNQQPANTARQLTNQCEFIFMLRQTSAGVELNKKLAYELHPEIFKTSNVGNVWELPFNSNKMKSEGFGRKELAGKWGHSGFPLTLPETCIALVIEENDLVLDPFLGSGTTGIASKKMGRDFVGIEMNESYFNLAKERIDNTQKVETLW